MAQSLLIAVIAIADELLDFERPHAALTLDKLKIGVAARGEQPA
jgi:hypothetical protein